MDQTTANVQSDTLATADVSDQSQPQEQSIDFQTLIPEEYKEEKSLHNFSNMNDFVKSYLHSQKLVGADKIPVPNKMATDEDWNAVYERLGRPQSPDGYKYDLPKETKLDEGQGLGIHSILEFVKQSRFGGLMDKLANIFCVNRYNRVPNNTDTTENRN